MADDRNVWRKNLPKDFDGRFGKKFDDEIDVKSVVQVSVGIAVTCAVTFVFAWVMMKWIDNRAAAAQPGPSVMAEADMVHAPPGPQLQAHPEEELEALRHEMQTRLDGYGWVDEAAGSVHIPIEKAIELLAQQAGTASHDDDAQAEGAAVMDATVTDATVTTDAAAQVDQGGH